MNFSSPFHYTNMPAHNVPFIVISWKQRTGISGQVGRQNVCRVSALSCGHILSPYFFTFLGSTPTKSWHRGKGTHRKNRGFALSKGTEVPFEGPLQLLVIHASTRVVFGLNWIGLKGRQCLEKVTVAFCTLTVSVSVEHRTKR